MHHCKCYNREILLPFIFMFDHEAMCNRCFWWAWRILEEGDYEK